MVKEMKKVVKLILGLKDEKGIVAIIVAVFTVGFIGFAALAVDVGYMMVTRNELQNVSDSAALAATRSLGNIYEGMTLEEQNDFIADPLVINTVAKNAAIMNQAGGENINISDTDIVIGQWNGVNKVLTPTLNQPDAVMVTSRRDSGPNGNGPISTIFARIFGQNSVDVTADATAALTGQGTIEDLPIPVGISSFRFEQDFCEQNIRFYPTNDINSCGGWHTYTNCPSNANELKNILIDLADLENGIFQTPEVIIGETEFCFTGGTLASVFDEMKALFDEMKDEGPPLDNDTDPNTWTTTVVVYEGTDCSNPNQTIKIIGFATVTITKVEETPEKFIEAIIRCNFIDVGRGGGGSFGTRGSIPNLVQ